VSIFELSFIIGNKISIKASIQSINIVIKVKIMNFYRFQGMHKGVNISFGTIGIFLLGTYLIGINEITGIAIASPLIKPLRNQIQTIAQGLTQSLYGLGLPKTAGTGGSVRLTDDLGLESSKVKTLPILALMVPEDGAKSASNRPTLYWNMILNKPQDYTLTFFLQETAEENSKVILEQEIVVNKGGLYKFQIPQSIDANTSRRWGVRCKWASGVIITANGILSVVEPKPEVTVALNAAKTDLDKAKIYAANGYWYDALDAYTQWINSNPQDAIAIQERSNVITEGFNGHKGLDTKSFVTQVNSAAIQEFK